MILYYFSTEFFPLMRFSFFCALRTGLIFHVVSSDVSAPVYIKPATGKKAQLCGVMFFVTFTTECQSNPRGPDHTL